MLKDFKQFILRGNVLDLAIAVVIGASFNGVVQSMVKDLITPLIASIGGQHDFNALHFTIHNSVFSYGAFLNTLIGFMITAVVVFFFVVQPMNRLLAVMNRAEPTVPTTRDCPECKSEIPQDASRCKYCTAVVKPHMSTAKLDAKVANA